MMLVPTFLLGAGMLGRAPMFEGDVRKEMTCVGCDGLGRVDKEDTCSTCRGRGVAEFILPGPNRPIQLVGTVKSSAGAAVKGAQVAAHEKGLDESEVVLETNGDGQFGLKVPPGEYVLKITSAESGSVTSEIKIEQNSAPIPAVGYDTLHRLEKSFSLSN